MTARSNKRAARNRWKVTDLQRFEDRIVVMLEDRLGKLNPAQFTFKSSHLKSYEWKDWGVQMDAEYHAGIDAAVRAYIQKHQ